MSRGLIIVYGVYSDAWVCTWNQVHRWELGWIRLYNFHGSKTCMLNVLLTCACEDELLASLSIGKMAPALPAQRFATHFEASN